MLRRKLLRDLVHLRGQAIAIALIVAAAIASYVTMRGGFESLLRSQARYYDAYRFAHVFASLERAPESVAGRLRAIAGVATVQTRVASNVVLDVPGLAEPASAQVLSLPDTGQPELNRVHIRRGRAPMSESEALVSEAFAEANGLAPGASIAAVINNRWRTLRVSGIAITPEYVNEARGHAFPDHRRFGVMWMSRRHLAAAMGMEGAFNDVSFALAPGASEPEVIAQADRILAPYGSLGAYGRDDQPSHQVLRDELAADRIRTLLMPAIFLAVAALLIHLLLQRLVTSQREQIAVLKAFGYGDAAVARHFAMFGVVIVGVGSLAGIPLGVLLGRGLMRMWTTFFHFPQLSFRLSAVAVSVSVGCTLLAALAGSWNAVRRVVALPPAEGMRPETPARFGQNAVDRTRLMRAVSTPVRIIVRGLVRRPLRTVLSVAAMATAGMLLVVTQFTFDSLDAMMDTQFRLAQTDDATIELTEVRGDEVLHALAAMPGVTRVEPMRFVPVRIRSAHHSRRIALVGLERDSRMRRLVAMNTRETFVPARGVVLTRKLADVLETEPGQLVLVEALTPPRSSSTMQVAALVDESIGMAAYASRDDVNRFMREGPSVTAAALAVQQEQAGRLYASLKSMPGVASVAVREAMLAGVRETIVESSYVAASMIVLFACLIAFGVIYNGARIALSERGRDLASLRVLGFTTAETGAMLLGEQALLTLASFPVGFAGGWALSAWISTKFDTEAHRLPMVISGRTYAISFLLIAAAALITSVVVQRRVARLDLVEVLKSRE